MLNNALKSIDPSFEVIERGWGTRCAKMGGCILACNETFAKMTPGQKYDWRCTESLAMDVSTVFLFFGTNDAKVRPFDMDGFKHDWIQLCQRF